MNARLLFIHALTPLHSGTGQGVGVIDLPVAREKATGLPFLPGSSLKGTLRDAYAGSDANRAAVFGPDPSNAPEHAGSTQFSDQRLLLLPVRSLRGTFAWVTSPYVLRRFARDARETPARDVPAQVPTPHPDGCLVGERSRLIVPMRDQVTRADRSRVVLEDLDLAPQADPAVTAWSNWLGARLFPDAEADAPAWRTMLAEQLCLVSDDVLSFLLATALEVSARVQLDDQAKTVKQGGLWYEEALPAETVLSGVAVVTPVEEGWRRAALTEELVFAELARLVAPPLQFGGKASVGRGICRVRLGGGA